jgi:hypothetical protein
LTLSEIVAAVRKRRITGSRGAHGGSSVAMAAASKKSLRVAEQERAELTHARRRWMLERGLIQLA